MTAQKNKNMHQLRNELESLLAKKVDRREFFQHLAVGLVAATGVTALLRSLGSFGGRDDADMSGYGGQYYSGRRSQ